MIHLKAQLSARAIVVIAVLVTLLNFVVLFGSKVLW